MSFLSRPKAGAASSSNRNYTRRTERRSSSAAGKNNKKKSSSTAEEVTRVKEMAADETRAIRTWRLLVAVLILGAGVLVSLVTYFYIQEQHSNSREESVSILIEIESGQNS